MTKEPNNDIWAGVFSLIDQRRLLEATACVRKLTGEHPELTADEVWRVEEDYRLMLHYVASGFTDPERETMHRMFTERLYRAVSDLRQRHRIRTLSVYADLSKRARPHLFTHDSIRRTLEDFVASRAMLGLEPEETQQERSQELYKQHQSFVSSLFCHILVSPQWNDADTQFFASLITSPTIDSIDALLLVSAITLATMQEFDSHKYLTLLQVYEQAADSAAIRQRALVGWAFTASRVPAIFNNVKARVEQLCQDEKVLQELSDMQKQVIFCMDAEKDHNTIQRDIMPTLMKNSDLNITRNGIITEKEDDPMEDILDPGAADRRMEEMEATIQKMVNMQKAGSDIYFGGFSQMKRFAFFYDISNWFCPFYIEHPAVSAAAKKVGSMRFLQVLIGRSPLCDSDKYSFLQAISSVVDRLPESVRETIASGVGGDEELMIEGTDTPEFSRRFYLQDLYRFFRLFHAKEQMWSPFGSQAFLFVTAPLFAETNLRSRYLSICDTLRQRQNKEGFALIARQCEGRDDADSLLVCGIYHSDYTHRPAIAKRRLTRLLELKPGHEKGLQYLGRACFDTADYALAADCFAQLHKLKPQKRSYALNLCIAQSKNGQAEEALPRLFQLNYEHPDDHNIRRILAWTLMGMHRLEQANEEYQHLMEEADGDSSDLLNSGYCLWFMGDTGGAARRFAQFLAQGETGKSISEEFRRDADLLDSYSIAPTDRSLMIDLAICGE